MRKTVIALMMALPIMAACTATNPAGGSDKPATPGATTPVTAPSGAPGASQVATGTVQADAKVTYKDFNFTPNETKIKTGQSVAFENPATNIGNLRVIADSGVFDSPEIEPGKTFVQKFDKAGTYTYRHHLQSSARGTIVVE
jgi:plastocyanin